MEANIRAVEERGDPSIIERYIEIARALTGDPKADAWGGVSWVRGLCAEMKIPPLRVAGLSLADFGRLIPLAQRASSMQGNPVKLSDEELHGILEASL
jgi:alcohol dehydrogenase class IV